MADEREAATPAKDADKSSEIDFAEFLESVPPSQFRRVADIVEVKVGGTHTFCYEINIPALQMHCPAETCNGPRVYRYKEGERIIGGGKNTRLTYITYLCSNCRKSQKIFSLVVVRPEDEDDQSTSAECLKFGEYPPYGPPTPTRLLRLFGRDREIFLKGRQCENHNLGIGAFVYYRRVVESHKDQILDEIIKVASKVSPELVPTLQSAKEEHQFSRAG